MPPNTSLMSRFATIHNRGRRQRATVFVSLTVLVMLAGCASVPNQWRDDGPAMQQDWMTPTEADVRARFEPSVTAQRDWPQAHVIIASGAVTHWPLYFEDPFVDKGSGNGPFDEMGTGRNEYRVGWQDCVAPLYCYARYTMNWLALPFFSAPATPPWTLMESDGHLSKQALGYDHDAARAD